MNLDALKQSAHAFGIYSSRVQLQETTNDEWLGLCPFHAEDTPSFRLFTRDNVLLFKCFGCQKTGNVIQFVQWLDNITFKEATQKVEGADWSKGRQKVEQTFKSIADDKTEKLTFPISRIRDAETALGNSGAAREWLTGRGIDYRTAQKFHLGFIQDAGVISRNHPWVKEGWIVFPTIQVEKITCLKYRSIKGKKTENGEPGFLRKSGMATSLFNLNAIGPFDDLLIVEGEPDCLVLDQAGFVSVSLPSAGYNPTAAEKDAIMQAHRIYLAGDADSVGQQTMHKLWTELRDRTYLIKWPEPHKDANEVFLKMCGGNVDKFRDVVEELKRKSHEQPLPHVYDLRDSLEYANDTRPLDNPDRMRFPWLGIDSWTAILPGDLMALFASESGMGKTSFLMDVLLHNAINFNKTIVNYSAEILPPQYARRAAAYLVRKNKDVLTKEDFQRASEMLGEAKFFNGYKPGANWREVLELLKWAKRRVGADIVTVDHLMFLTRSERDETKAQSEAMRAFKDFALEYNCIVVIVGQPRKVYGREVTMQDAKGSEAFGSDASQVFILHRKRVPNDGSEEAPVFSPETKVTLDKSRESGTRATKLFFRGEICGFFPLERTDERSLASFS